MVWVVGGPSCTSLSTAGKQLAGKDPTSRYLFDHLIMAAACGATLILLENVLPLVEDDSTHGLYTKLLQQAAALGYTLVGWQPIVYSKTAARLFKAAWCLLRIATPYPVSRRLMRWPWALRRN